MYPAMPTAILCRYPEVPMGNWLRPRQRPTAKLDGAKAARAAIVRPANLERMEGQSKIPIGPTMVALSNIKVLTIIHGQITPQVELLGETTDE